MTTVFMRLQDSGPRRTPRFPGSWALALLVAAAACAPTSSGADAVEAGEDAWSGVDTWDPVAPAWEPTDMEVEVAAVLARGFPSPTATSMDFEAFIDDVIAERAPGHAQASIAEDRVLAEYNGRGALGDGTTYDGGWIYSRAIGNEQGGVTKLEVRFLASFTLVDPEGHLYVRGGEARGFILEESAGEGQYFYKVGGIWSYAPSASWVGLDQSAAIGVEGRRTAAGDTFTLSGGLDGAVELYVRDLSFDPAVCGGLPVGEVLVRDPTFYWHTVTLTDDCSGCGVATWAGAPEGEVCVGETLADAAQQAIDSLWELR